MRGSQAAVRTRRRDQGDTVSKRAERALELVQMGELSAERVALEGAQIALGDDATGHLQSPEHLYHSPSLIAHPEKNSSWTRVVCAACAVRQERSSSWTFRHGGRSFAADVGQRQRHFVLVPIRVSVGVRTRSSDRSGSHQDGQIIVLRKLTGGVRGIIVGDVFRRLVARTMAKQMAVRVE